MTEPTDRQLEVLRFIAQTAEECGFPPTIREMCEEFDIRSTNGVDQILRALIHKGLLERKSRKARTISLTADGMAFCGFPLNGKTETSPAKPRQGGERASTVRSFSMSSTQLRRGR